MKAALDPRSPQNSICLKTLEQHTGRVFRLQFDEFQIVSSSHDDTILIWNFLNVNQPQDNNVVNGAWPALAAHSSTHRLPNNGIFGLAGVRLPAQNNNRVAAPPPPVQQQHAADAQMEVDEPVPANQQNNDDSGSDTNHTDDEEVQLVANG